MIIMIHALGPDGKSSGTEVGCDGVVHLVDIGILHPTIGFSCMSSCSA